MAQTLQQSTRLSLGTSSVSAPVRSLTSLSGAQVVSSMDRPVSKSFLHAAPSSSSIWSLTRFTLQPEDNLGPRCCSPSHHPRSMCAFWSGIPPALQIAPRHLYIFNHDCSATPDEARAFINPVQCRLFLDTAAAHFSEVIGKDLVHSKVLIYRERTISFPGHSHSFLMPVSDLHLMNKGPLHPCSLMVNRLPHLVHPGSAGLPRHLQFTLWTTRDGSMYARHVLCRRITYRDELWDVRLDPPACDQCSEEDKKTFKDAIAGLGMG